MMTPEQAFELSFHTCLGVGLAGLVIWVAYRSLKWFMNLISRW